MNCKTVALPSTNHGAERLETANQKRGESPRDTEKAVPVAEATMTNPRWVHRPICRAEIQKRYNISLILPPYSDWEPRQKTLTQSISIAGISTTFSTHFQTSTICYSAYHATTCSHVSHHANLFVYPSFLEHSETSHTLSLALRLNYLSFLAQQAAGAGHLGH